MSRHFLLALPLIAAGLVLHATPAAAARSAEAGEALVRAVRAGDLEGARAAIKAKANPDLKADYGASPLAIAVNTQNLAMVDLLLAAGADPDAADTEGLTPLALACELGGEGVISSLIEAGAKLALAAPDGTTPLATCARFAPASTTVRMLALGASADTADARGQTPLMWAASSGNVNAMKALIDAGADVNRVTPGGFTPLFYALKSSNPAATALLLKAGADTAHRGPEDTSALQLALYQDNFEAARLLLASGARFDLTAIDRNGNQPLHVAAKGGAVDLVSLLVQQGADPNGVTGPSRIKWVTEANFGMPPPPVPPTPPLLRAAEAGQLETMKRLVGAGAKPDFVAENGVGVVIAAAKGKDAAALAYALELAPDANAADGTASTALHHVLYAGLDPELEPMLRVLKEHGARTDIANKFGMTAAQMADKGLTEVKAIYEKVFVSPSVHAKARAQASPQG